jgi:ATP-dependent Clp protease ATP-binding subunit ClpA
MAASGHRIAQLATEAAEAAAPLDALRVASELRRELDGFEREQVALALAEGQTFAGIARDLGLTRQAVHRRFRDLARGETLPVMSPDARRVLRDAREEALALGVRAASEHVLLAALRAVDLPAGALLRTAGASWERGRALVDGTSTRAPLFCRGGSPGDDPRTLTAGPAAEAHRRGTHRVEAEDLLIGVLSDSRGGAARMLRALDVDLDLVRTELGMLRDSRGAAGNRHPA